MLITALHPSRIHFFSAGTSIFIPSLRNIFFSHLLGLWRMLMSEVLPSSRRECEERFNTLINRHSQLIERVAFAYASSPEEMNDIRQDILINVWRGIQKFEQRSAETTWLYRVALNTCVSTIRKRKARPATIPLSSYNAELPADDPDDREIIEELHQQIQMLPPTDRALLLLRLEERPYEEIAGIMGINRNTVATRLRRIRERLNASLHHIVAV